MDTDQLRSCCGHVAPLLSRKVGARCLLGSVCGSVEVSWLDAADLVVPTVSTSSSRSEERPLFSHERSSGREGRGEVPVCIVAC